MNTDLYEIEAQYWEDSTKPREYNNADGSLTTEEIALHLIKHNIDLITMEQEDDETLFIQVDVDDNSMFTIFMDLVAIALPSIDQTYFRSLDEVQECTYVLEDEVVNKSKIEVMIQEIKTRI